MIKKLTLFLVHCFVFIKINGICPICTLATGFGVGLSKWLGIDDTITGIWIGGLTASIIGWTITFLNKHNIRFFGRKILVTIGYYFIILYPLYCNKFIGAQGNKLWGIDKLLLGTIIGTILFVLSYIIYVQIKKQNKHFPFLKILLPVAVMLIFSAIFYFITR